MHIHVIVNSKIGVGKKDKTKLVDSHTVGLELPTLPCTCARVRRAGRLLTQAYDRALQPLDLKLTQYSVLINVARDEGLTISALATRLVMDRTTLTRNLRPLERAGLIRVKAGRDARSRSVGTTRHGRKLLRKAIPRWREVEDRVRDSLGHEDVLELHRLLDTVGSSSERS